MSGGPERLVVLLGHPLGHSSSPTIHNSSFGSQDLPFRYELCPTPPDQLRSTLQRLKQEGFAGANVTVPHKEAVVSLIDDPSATVAAIGAANTLVHRDDGSIFADNTDVGGFIDTLGPAFRADRPCVVFGAGGAARAVVYGLLTRTPVPSIQIGSRRIEQAAQLVADLQPHDPTGRAEYFQLDGGEAAQHRVRHAGLLVNTTPAGMHPGLDETPWRDTACFMSGQLVYDLIYNPSETRLMREAALAGAAVQGGLEMLIRQAQLSYRHWTGRDLDIDSARAALNR